MNVNTAASTRVTTTITDWLGRTVSETYPNPAGGTALTKTISYLSSGLKAALTSATATLIKPYRYEYDSLGRIIREGTDLNSNGILDLASTEPITEYGYGYESIGGQWYSVSENRAYRMDGSATPAIVSTNKSRLSASDSSGAASHSISISATGLTAETREYLARSTKIRTVSTTRSDHAIEDSEQYENGLRTNAYSAEEYATYSYDALERLKTSTDYNFKSTTTYAYDSVSQQLASVTDALGNTTSYSYYPPAHANAGLLQTTTDALLKQTQRSYNDRSQPVREWGAASYPTERAYTSWGQLNTLKTFRAGTGWTNATWPTGSEGIADLTTWTFTEATGLLANKKDNLNRQVTYTYHPNGQVATRLNSRNITSTYGGFDGLGLPTTTTYSDGTPSLTFARNRDVSLKTLTDAAGTHTRTYYPTGLTNQITTTAGLLNGVQHTYTQDSSGSTLTYSATQSSVALASQSHIYEMNWHHLQSVTSGSHLTVYSLTDVSFYNSFPDTNISQYYLGNNVVSSSRVFDKLSRQIVTESYLDGGFIFTPVASHRIELYDALHRRRTVKSLDATTWDYTYNDRSELLTGTHKLPSAQPLAGQQYTYSYDNLGNVTQKQTGGDETGANLRTQTSPANTLNQYATYQTPSSFDVIGQAPAGSTVTVNGTAATFQDTFFRANVATANTGANGIWQSVAISDGTTTTTGNLFVPPASFTPTYDLDGNLTDDGEWTYLWDAENRMKTTTRAARAVTAGAPYRRFDHIYDAMSRLVQTKTFDSAAAIIPLKTEQYIYNGWNRVAMLESTGSATPALRQSYVWGLDISNHNGHPGQDSGGVGALLVVTDTQLGSHYPCYDCNGNITTMVNAATKAVSAQYEYSPFGETTRATGPFAEANPYRFSTKPTNSETGLIYYGYRFYKPKWQTWPSRDPIGEDGGANLYGFVGNDANNYTDTLGLWAPYPGMISDPSVMPPPSPTGPGCGDQFNPGGIRGATGKKDYAAWFEIKFPKTIKGAKSSLEDRITKHISTKYCFGKADTFNSSELGNLSDIDINPDMKRFGDPPQGWYMRNVQIGFFELKFKDVKITWDKEACKFTFTAIMYVLEQTGVGPGEKEEKLQPLCGKRYVNMGEWNLSGNGLCGKR